MILKNQEIERVQEGVIDKETLENIFLSCNPNDWIDNFEVMTDDYPHDNDMHLLIVINKKIMILYGNCLNFKTKQIENLIKKFRDEGWFIRQESQSILKENNYLKVR